MPDHAGGSPESVAVDRRVERAIADNEVVLFLNDVGDPPRCRFSRTALALVARHRDSFERVDVSPAPDRYRAALSARSEWVTIPQVFVDGTFVGDDDVLADLAEAGELAATLATP